MGRIQDAINSLKAPDNDQDIISQTDIIWKYQRDGRRKAEYRWYVDESYYDNNQTIQYNTSTRRAQFNNQDRNSDKVVINKAFQQVRGIVNFLNAEHPSVGVRPGNDSDTSYLRSKKEKHLADYWYRHLAMNTEAKLVSTSAAKTGIGWMKTTYNNDALAPTSPFQLPNGSTQDFQYGELQTNWVDTWEVYPDPMAKNKANMRHITHAVVRTVAEIQSNPLYMNRDKVKGDGQLAASKLRSTQIRQNVANNLQETGQPNGMDTCLTLEMFRKIYDPLEAKWNIWVTTRTENGVLLRNEKWNLDEFPFEVFTVEVSSTILGSRGIIHNIREPSRALNQLVTQVQESARIMGKLNWLMPRGSNVNVITDETGQFIEYDVTPGGAPRQAEAASLPSYIMQQIGYLSKTIDDIGGMHASFNGNAPFAQASGDLVDSLSEGDQNNLTLMRDNYDDFFVRQFKLMFKTAKVNYNTKRKFPSSMEDGFGQSRWFEILPNEISTNDDLDVSTGTQMPYSNSQKQQMFMNLWKEHAITDPGELFKLLALPEIDAVNGDDENDIERQLNEIRSVIDKGSCDQPILAENHAVHIATIDKFIRGDDFKKLDPKKQQALTDHRSQHIDFTIQIAQIAAAQQVEPIKRSVTSMLRINSMNDTTPMERTQLMQRLGITSDAAQIQARGGLSIQDPQQAEIQAQNEDIEMMEFRPVNVSFADNHQVHLETHQQIVNHPNFVNQPSAVQQLFNQHVKDHIAALQATASSPGLMPNNNSSLPNTPTLNAPTVAGEPIQNNVPPATPLEAQQEQLVAEEQQQQQATQQFLAQKGAQAPPPSPSPQITNKKRSK